MNAFAGMMSTLAESFFDDVKHASGLVLVLHGVAEAEAADDAAVFYVVHDGVDCGVALAANESIAGGNLPAQTGKARMRLS